jgi:hypothetical protein
MGRTPRVPEVDLERGRPCGRRLPRPVARVTAAHRGTDEIAQETGPDRGRLPFCGHYAAEILKNSMDSARFAGTWAARYRREARGPGEK